jgi:hypothetical protein
MKGIREEAEVIVRLDQQDGMVHICVASWPAMYRKMYRLYGQSLDGLVPGQSARWKLPIKCVSFRRIPQSGDQPTARGFALKPRKRPQSGDSNAENVPQD